MCGCLSYCCITIKIIFLPTLQHWNNLFLPLESRKIYLINWKNFKNKTTLSWYYMFAQTIVQFFCFHVNKKDYNYNWRNINLLTSSKGAHRSLPPFLCHWFQKVYANNTPTTVLEIDSLHEFMTLKPIDTGSTNITFLF